jgi:hypothetical protein
MVLKTTRSGLARTKGWGEWSAGDVDSDICCGYVCVRRMYGCERRLQWSKEERGREREKRVKTRRKI